MGAAATTHACSGPGKDTAKLPDRLARLRDMGSRAQPAARVLNFADRSVAMAAVLREIDETMLPRRLTLKSETGTGLQLDVASRRVLANGLTDVDSRSIAQRIVQVLEGAGPVVLSVERIDKCAEAGATGISAMVLAEAAGVDPVLVRRAEPAAALWHMLKGQSAARILLDGYGQVLNRAGNAGWVGKLEELASDQLMELDNALSGPGPNQERPGCLLLGAGRAEMLLYVRGWDQAVLAIVPTKHLALVQDAWNQCLA